jgi:nicotinamidase-related amidase
MAEPAHSTVALLLVDVINDMVFEGSESLVRHAEPMAARLRLRARCPALCP